MICLRAAQDGYAEWCMVRFTALVQTSFFTLHILHFLHSVLLFYEVNDAYATTCDIEASF